MKDPIDRMQQELSSWRGKLDELRVKANLGKKELRDRHPQLFEEFDDAYRNARESVGKLADTGVSTGRTAVEALAAGWDELRRVVDRVRGGDPGDTDARHGQVSGSDSPDGDETEDRAPGSAR